jgi:hypothetical protein
MQYLLPLLFCAVVSVGADKKDDVIKEYQQQVKTLQQELFRSDMFVTVGRKWFAAVLNEVRELRRENTTTKKALQTARDYLERLPKPVYISDISGKIYDETDSPLYREHVARRIVEEKLKKEQEDRALDNAVLERKKISQLNRDLYLIASERDRYKQQMEEARRYFQALRDRGFIPTKKEKK